LLIQYLHTYSYENPLSSFQMAHVFLSNRYDKVIYITANRILAKLIQDYILAWNIHWVDVIHLPPAVDVQRITETETEPNFFPSRVIYFGNLLNPKQGLANHLKQRFKQQ